MGSMDLVYNIARRVVARPEDAQDLVQETYLQAFRAWQDHRRPRKAEPWLATICLNLARSSYRSKARRPDPAPLEDAATIASTEDPEHDAIAAIDTQTLHRAMWRLPEGQRIALTLVDLMGLSTAEAAQVMGTPRGTVLSRLHRGRKALAIMLAPRQEETERGK